MTTAGFPVHGGDLAGAMLIARNLGLNPGLAEDWLDLSTGINPASYPLPALSPVVWQRLPNSNELNDLLDAAVDYYKAPDHHHITASSGSAFLIQMLPSLFATKKVAIVSPTYGDHEKSWSRCGFEVERVDDLGEINPGGIVVLVNPNNPDGRCTSLSDLSNLAERQTTTGGWLIVDEAFGDCQPEYSASPLTKERNVVVLKSVGKFFGLAGLRLGFAIAPPEIIQTLNVQLGSWAVSGPALAVGKEALRDKGWQVETRLSLKMRAQKFKAILERANLDIGGTDLFRLIETTDAPAIFERFLKHKIYVRRFAYNPHWLRLGIPGNDTELARVTAVINS